MKSLLSLVVSMGERIIAKCTRRDPDFVIGDDDDPYLLRWWIARNRLFCVYLHCFRRSDDDRALHDHPWLWNASALLRGMYIEHTIRKGGIHVRQLRLAGDIKVRIGPAPHRIELLRTGLGEGPTQELGPPWECWTLFVTGPRVRQWGFHCENAGWIHWKEFTKSGQPGQIGNGCDA